MLVVRNVDDGVNVQRVIEVYNSDSRTPIYDRKIKWRKGSQTLMEFMDFVNMQVYKLKGRFQLEPENIFRMD